MPRSIVFQFGDRDLTFAMHKIDRAKLYGYKELEAVDDEDRTCELATLADDGRTLIGRGGTGLGYVSADGDWCDKAQLTPVNVEGEVIEPVPSSFSEPIQLFDTATSDDYLDHDVRLVYQLKSEDDFSEDDFEDLTTELQRGTIFCFPFSYRGGLEPDAGFMLLGQDGSLFLVVGTMADVEFVGLSQTAPVADESIEDQDLMDFDMI